MATAKKIIDIAYNEVGITEKPANSNKVKYNTEYYGSAVSGSGYPWCCAFVWWVFKHADASNLFYDGKKTALCATLMQWFKNRGRFYSKNTTPKPGDVVFYNFSGGSTAKHVGIVSSGTSATINAIEGNTSTGNDANGGAVMVRTRVSKYILGYGRPDYDDDTSTDEASEDVTTSDTTVVRYKATANLWLRKSPNGVKIIVIPKNTIVTKTDTPSKVKSGLTWHHIEAVVDGDTYTGYSYDKYLKKV